MFYGAAQFSRALDLTILADPENIARLRNALDELEADAIAVPPLAEHWLEAGHAIHFRCRHKDVGSQAKRKRWNRILTPEKRLKRLLTVNTGDPSEDNWRRFATLDRVESSPPLH